MKNKIKKFLVKGNIYNQDNRQNAGITLIALVITIIILLILAGVLIAQLTGNGLFEKAKLAKEVSKNAQDDEDDKIKQYGNEINQYLQGGRNISDFETEITHISASEVTIKVKKETIKEEISNYYYIVGSEMKKDTAEIATIDGLDEKTTYDVLVLAVTTNQKHLISKTSITTESRIYLYNNGDKCTSITGGWRYSGYDGNSTGSFDANNYNYIYITSVNGGRTVGTTTNAIDLTQYKKIYMEYEGTMDSIYINKYDNVTGKSEWGGVAIESKKPVDISTYNDNYYIHVSSVHGKTIKIHKVWLEK